MANNFDYLLTKENLSQDDIFEADSHKLATWIDENTDVVEEMEKMKFIIFSYYNLVVAKFKEYKTQVEMLDSNNPLKFSNLFQFMKKTKQLDGDYFNVYMADITYNDTSIITDEIENEISALLEGLISALHKKLLEFENDNEEIKNIVKQRNFNHTQANLLRNNLYEKYKSENKTNEYPDAINNCEEYHRMCKISNMCDIGLYVFTKNRTFCEKIQNEHNEELVKEYSKVYIKRRVHQFTFSRDEMLQYVIKPSYGMESNANLVKEVYQDIGHFVPTHKKNMKQMLLAFEILCNYELDESFYEMCSVFDNTSDSRKRLSNAYSKAKQTLKYIEDVCDAYSYAFSYEGIVSDIESNFKQSFRNFKRNLYEKISITIPETQPLFDKINELREEIAIESQKYGPFEPRGEEIHERYKIIEKIEKEIISALE